MIGIERHLERERSGKALRDQVETVRKKACEHYGIGYADIYKMGNSLTSGKAVQARTMVVSQTMDYSTDLVADVLGISHWSVQRIRRKVRAANAEGSAI